MTELQVTGLDLKNKTGIQFGNTSFPISVPPTVNITENNLYNNTTRQNTTTTVKGKENGATTTSIGQAIQKDVSAKSEIYKMHTNGLMLLHAQRSTQGNGAKKSQLAASISSASNKGTDAVVSEESPVNYHVWKKSSSLSSGHRVKNNESSPSLSSVSINENFLETTKLGSNLQKIKNSAGKRDTTPQKRQGNINTGTVALDLEPTSLSPCLDCNIVLATEKRDVRLSEITNSLPQRNKRQINSLETKTDLTPNPVVSNLLRINKRHQSIPRRVLHKRNSDNPLFDDDQPEQVFERYKEKRRLLKLQSRYEQAGTRGGGDVPPIAPIKAIPDIKSRFDKIEPLEHFPRFAPFGPDAYDNWPRFGVPDLSLEHYPRFAAPKMDDFELLPGIPHIRPLSRGDEVTGSKRDYPEKAEDDFYDQELDDDIEHNSPITSPTSIPFLTNIPDIQDIQDIPTIAPAAAAARKSRNGEPAVDTIHTKDGDETRVST